MKIRLAIVSNEQTPYRLHLHRRIVHECPDIELFSVFTHDVASSPWSQREAAEINPVLFGSGDASASQSSLHRAPHEWVKGGAVIRWMERQQIGAVVLLGYNDPGRLRILRWCNQRGIPCFLFGDSNILCDRIEGFGRLVKSAVVSRVIEACAGVLHCGKLGREYFLRYGARPERLFSFPYEPDYSRFVATDPARLQAVRERYGIQTNARYVMYSGRLAEVKRVDLLMDAFAEIADCRPEWRLLIAGSGPLRGDLRNRIPCTLRDRVLWTGFIDDPADLAALYQSAEVLAIPSDYEPWGVVVTEAVAAGLAVVASSVVGAAADVLQDGRNGRVFRAGDERHFEECLLNVTGPEIRAMRSASPGVLARWRHDTDPVAGLRRALTSAGLRFNPSSEHLSTV